MPYAFPTGSERGQPGRGVAPASKQCTSVPSGVWRASTSVGSAKLPKATAARPAAVPTSSGIEVGTGTPSDVNRRTAEVLPPTAWTATISFRPSLSRSATTSCDRALVQLAGLASDKTIGNAGANSRPSPVQA